MENFFGNEWVLFLALTLGAAVLAGFLAGLFGIGGGAVMVPVFSEMYMLAGQPLEQAMMLAVGTSLAIIIPTSIKSATTHHEKKNTDTRVLGMYIWAVPIGVLAGLFFARAASGGVLTAIFGVMAVALAIYMLAVGKSLKLADGGPKGWVAYAGGGVIGFFSLLMGIGGGVMNNIFMMAQGTPIKKAIGTSAALGTMIAIPGAIGFVVLGFNQPNLPYLSIGYVNLITFIIAIPVTTFLAPYGARMTHRLPEALTSRLFGIFLVLVGLRMVWKFIGSF